MRTMEATIEEMWGPYPTLRQVLEKKKLSAEFYGLTSVSGNMVDQMHRLIEIAILVNTHRADIKNAMPTLGRDELSKDLSDIQDELGRSSGFLRAMCDRVRAVLDTLG